MREGRAAGPATCILNVTLPPPPPPLLLLTLDTSINTLLCACLATLVTRGVLLLTADPRAVGEVIGFDACVHLACAKRGWAALCIQADSPRSCCWAGNFVAVFVLQHHQAATADTSRLGVCSFEHLDVELVAKHVHVAWVRALRTEWDMDYGDPPRALLLTDSGELDSACFQKGQGSS